MKIKTRVLSLTVILAMALVSLAVPKWTQNAVAAGPYGQDASSSTLTSLLSGGALELTKSYTVKVATDVKAPVFKSYVYIEAEKLANPGTTKVNWKEVKPGDLTVDGYLSVASDIKKAGTLIFTTTIRTEAVKLVASFTSFPGADKSTEISTSISADFQSTPGAYISITVPVPGDKLRLTKPKYNIAEALGYAVLTEQNLEYIPLNAGPAMWKDVTNTTFEPKNYKQDFMVRTKAAADGTVGPSAAVKLAVPALGNPPSVKVNPAKPDTAYTGKANSYQYAPATSEGKPDLSQIKTMTDKYIPMDDGTKGFPATAKFFVRVAPTATKPASLWALVDFSQYTKAATPTVENFAIGPKQTILVTGSVPIEYMKGTKWTKARSFKPDDLINGVTIRVAGSKFQWPGDPMVLKYNAAEFKIVVEPVPVTP